MHELHAVVIAGGGPTGMMLAAELALARVDVVVVERRASPALLGARARGLHTRTIEILDQRGVADRFLSQGQPMQNVSFVVPLDLGDAPTRHPYGLALPQERFEQLLAAWVSELGVPMLRGREVTGFAEDADGVTVELSGGGALRARYLVGCDGGRSLVRKQAGIEFPGWDASLSYLIAEGELGEEPPWGIRHAAQGVNAIGKLDEGRRAGIVLIEPEVRTDADAPTLDDLRAALVAAYGRDFGVRDVTWLSRFSDAARQAAAYRKGRVLLAGDAAHVHSPVGGQGLNTGVQDAVNLGWKLAQVVRGTSPEGLLDSYHAERHPVGARMLRTTMAITATQRGDERSLALREQLAELMRMDEPRRRTAAMLTALDVRYDLGDGHPLLGRRMPDLDLVTSDGPRRVYEYLHDARPLLLNLGERGAFDVAPWADRVRRVDARHGGVWELPAIGVVPPAAAVLIRPDGHVAWVADGRDHGPADALARWFGPAAG